MQLLRPVTATGQANSQYLIDVQQATSGQVRKGIFVGGGVLGYHHECRTAKMRMTKRQLPSVVDHHTVEQPNQGQYHRHLIQLTRSEQKHLM